MTKPNFLSTVRFLSLATAALVTRPAASATVHKAKE